MHSTAQGKQNSRLAATPTKSLPHSKGTVPAHQYITALDNDLKLMILVMEVANTVATVLRRYAMA